MMRDDQVYVLDMIQSIELIQEYLSDVSEADFEQSFLLQDAVFRRFEIMGEAAGKISEELRGQHPAIEWRLIRAMRNKLSHEYFGISAPTVFLTVTNNLPPLLQKLKAIEIRLNQSE